MYIAKYIPCAGASYIPTPIKIKRKKCLVNIKNKDSKCFIYAVLSSMFPRVNKHGYTSRNPRSYAHFEKRIITNGKKIESILVSLKEIFLLMYDKSNASIQLKYNYIYHPSLQV